MIDKLSTEKTSPFACDMDALAPEERPQHLAVISRLFGLVQNIHELPNGYAFLLADGPDVPSVAGEFISRERLCCPFFGFSLDVEPEGGSVKLHMTGREGVKPFIQAEIGEFLSKRIAGWPTTGNNVKS
jgi:hypothetical protein